VPAAVAQQTSQSPFFSIPPVPTDTLRFGDRIPDFEAKDIDGRTWHRADLAGKFTVIYIWHTADPDVPRFNNLPEVQRFFDQVKGAKNLQVLTFCRDYDYTHAPEFMKRKGYTFPVIAEWSLIRKLFPSDRMPGWYAVVNPEERLSYPARGWSFGHLLFEVERAAGLN
jgi:cytochrome c biogenesis protein CcmG/thiol:disulfide interchange protein DsbE